jgi:hypothetical protein
MLREIFCPQCHKSAGFRDDQATGEMPHCEKCGQPTQFVARWTDNEARLLTTDAHLDPTTEESRVEQVTQTRPYGQRRGKRKLDDV